MYYPAHIVLNPESDIYSISFRDIPEALSQGFSFNEAKTMAVDALSTGFQFYFEDFRKVPVPSAAEKDEVLINVPLALWAKVLLLNKMLDLNISKSELARRLNTTRQQVQRIFDAGQNTKIETVHKALGVIGYSLELNLFENNDLIK